MNIRKTGRNFHSKRMNLCSAINLTAQCIYIYMLLGKNCDTELGSMRLHSEVVCNFWSAGLEKLNCCKLSFKFSSIFHSSCIPQHWFCISPWTVKPYSAQLISRYLFSLTCAADPWRYHHRGIGGPKTPPSWALHAPLHGVERPGFRPVYDSFRCRHGFC